jgi:hypothetical protein
LNNTNEYQRAGAISNAEGKLFIDSTYIANNQCEIGAIYNYQGEVKISNSELYNNSSTAILNESGTVSVANCIFRKNSTTTDVYGSAIHNYGDFYLVNTLVTENENGNAIYNNGTFNLLNCTVAGNYSSGYSGIYQVDNNTVNAKNTVFDVPYLQGNNSGVNICHLFCFIMLVAIKSPKLLVTNKNVFFFSGTGRSSP